jgi:hypothetical protein
VIKRRSHITQAVQILDAVSKQSSVKPFIIISLEIKKQARYRREEYSEYVPRKDYTKL